MRLFFEQNFLKSAKKLPSKIQNKLTQQTELLLLDPHHPLLHTKQLIGNMDGYFSFRITRDWRVIFSFINTKSIQLLKVTHRKNAYK